MWDVVGIGALNWDLIYTLPSLTLLEAIGISLNAGEEIYLEEEKLESLLEVLNKYGSKKSESGGGQAANTLFALSRMGFRTKMFGKAGKDNWGDAILQGLSGVDTRDVAREGRSGICFSILTPSGERSMMILPNANDTLKVDDIDLSVILDSRFLHLTSFAGKCPLYAQISIVGGLTRRPLISFDPGSLYAHFGLDTLMPILEMTYILFVTDSELEEITDLPHCEAAEKMLELGVRMVVCKQGAQGAYLLDHQGYLHFPPPGKEAKFIRGYEKYNRRGEGNFQVKDTTGAGDCFAAGFLAGLLKGFDLKQCGRLGTLAAASCIQGYGRESYPDEGIFNQFLFSSCSSW